MHHWTRRLFAIAAPLLLTGCLWGPGKFNSDLTLKKDGSFVLDYRGEITLQLPPEAASRETITAALKSAMEARFPGLGMGVALDIGSKVATGEMKWG